MTDTPTTPEPIDCYTVWHQDLKWGLGVPMLFPSEIDAVARIKGLGLWPLRDGWRLIRVRITPCP